MSGATLRCYSGAVDRTFEEMSPAERIRHVQDLWDRIAATPENVPVTEEMRAELRRRLAEHEASPADTVSWDEVKARARRAK